MESMEPFGLEEDASLFLNGPCFNGFKEWAQAVSRDPHRHGFECFSGAEATHPPPVASYLDESRPQQICSPACTFLLGALVGKASVLFKTKHHHCSKL